MGIFAWQTMGEYISLGYTDVLLASGLLVVNAALSLKLGLGLERQLLVAAARMCVQLFLVGMVLKALFSFVSLWLTLGVLAIMGAVAGYEVLARQTRRLTGWWAYGLGTTTVVTSGLLITVLALTTEIRAEPWYHPRYAIPLFGMIAGNLMTGVAIGLNTLTVNATRDAAACEARLALGATRWQALNTVIREAMASGLIPVINAMAATGIVSLPGMMTGQILAGVDPNEAVKYQLLVMFLIGGATSLGVFFAVYGGAWRLTDDRHRLRLDRLRAPTR
jgi:putative ABC transport system permease protein